MTPVFDAAFAPFSHIVLAVSGGPDSMALLHLAVAWRQAAVDAAASTPAPTFSLATVDHGLRSASAAEAETVAAAAARLGVPHTTLPWEGTKPTSGIQAAARAARLALLRRHLACHQWSAVAMAHTADDQAETLLMRLARGSGLDGLGAMRTAKQIGPGQMLIRPLLDVPKARLIKYLEARGISWIADPSNEQPAFERVRIRRARTALSAAGFDLDSRALGRSALRLARASAALSACTAEAWLRRPATTHLSSLGYVTLDWPWLVALPEEIRLRLLSQLIAAVGGCDEPVSMGQLEAFTVARHWTPPVGTLHRVEFLRARGATFLIREWGRHRPAPCAVIPGHSQIWDARFRLTWAADLDPALEISCLAEAGVAELRTRGWMAPDAPSRALLSLPALRSGGRLVAVPALGLLDPTLTPTTRPPADCVWIGPAFAVPQV